MPDKKQLDCPIWEPDKNYQISFKYYDYMVDSMKTGLSLVRSGEQGRKMFGVISSPTFKLSEISKISRRSIHSC